MRSMVEGANVGHQACRAERAVPRPAPSTALRAVPSPAARVRINSPGQPFSLRHASTKVAARRRTSSAESPTL
jgi:hypothetical protein